MHHIKYKIVSELIDKYHAFVDCNNDFFLQFKRLILLARLPSSNALLDASFSARVRKSLRGKKFRELS